MNKGFIIYFGISAFILLVAVVRIRQLEQLVGVSARKKIPNVVSVNSYLATCVWVDKGDNETLIPEFIASHLSQGFIGFTIYVSDTNDEFISNLLNNYTNLGLPLTFLNRTRKEADIWECLTENIFNPMTSYVLLTDVDSVLFPLKNRYSRLNPRYEECVEFPEYKFIESDTHYSNSVVETHKNRTVYETGVKKMLKMGNSVTERIEFIKRFNHNSQRCTKSLEHGIAKYTEKVAIGDYVRDERPSSLRSSYHVIYRN